ncbi:MAG: LPS assembly protein LptD, partial [Candidatus Zixiibacteriota bacterium]
MKSQVKIVSLLLLAAGSFFLIPVPVVADSEPLILEPSGPYEFIRGHERDTIFIRDSVVFRHGDRTFLANQAIWIKQEAIILEDNVYIEDSLYQLWADKVVYEINENIVRATGQEVILLSGADSLKAIGTNAYFSRDSSLFRMVDRPTMFLNYPDSTRLVQIDADRIAFEVKNKIGYGDGQVIITQAHTESHSGRAVMYADDNVLVLYDQPVARRRASRISGDTLIFFSSEKTLEKIHVQGNAAGDFTEPGGSDSTVYDKFDLKAQELEFYLSNGDLNTVIATRQAYSYYAPGTGDSAEVISNRASGDTIKLFLSDQRLSAVNVIGGAEGEYLNGKQESTDSGSVFVMDSIRYSGDFIDYNLKDSTIVLDGMARVSSKEFFLSASRIDYLTSRELVKAYHDSARVDSAFVYYPVVLNDGTDELIGSYLEYSLDTERGLIRQTRSEYQEAFYRGRELYREEKDIYYVEGGMYTSCDRNDPHFHFWSKNMKMIRGDRVIVRPVVFYIEKMPLMIFPYYVFPIKPGRHSGFLPFKFGNFERGDRYLENVGYYWAASEYWDLKAWLNYYEDYGLKFNSSVRYNVRYLLSGSVSGSYNTDSRYVNYQKEKSTRWSITFGHNQTISPTFTAKASGNFISDKSYYTDFSTDEQDRLNRNLRSQLSLSKRLGNASINAQFIHEDALDEEVRTDRLPSASVSLPSRPLFGSPGKNPDGTENRHFYHNFYANYRA